MNLIKYTRGSVWWFKRYTNENGITKGNHPCVIISSDEWNDKAASVVVVPATTTPLAGTMLEPTIEINGGAGYYFPTQITTIPKKNLVSFLGMLEEHELEKLEQSVSAVLHLNESSLSSLLHMKNPQKENDAEDTRQRSTNNYTNYTSYKYRDNNTNRRYDNPMDIQRKREAQKRKNFHQKSTPWNRRPDSIIDTIRYEYARGASVEDLATLYSLDVSVIKKYVEYTSTSRNNYIK